jgi:maltooligosyltrehalose synthase
MPTAWVASASMRPPRATYRLQLHAGFTFDDAAGIGDR